jgi:TRAP-type C4-dicarboxylate transport system permease small subunit
MIAHSSIDPFAATGAVALDGAPLQPAASGPVQVPRASLLRLVDSCAEGLVITALLAELAVVLANVLARAFFQHSFLWADEVARLSLSVLAFIGGAVAYRRREHAFVRIALNLIPKAAAQTCLCFLISLSFW